MNRGLPVFPKPPDGFRWVERGGVLSLEWMPLREVSFIGHAFCSRWRGASRGAFAGLNFSTREGDTDEAVRQNRALLSAAFDLPAERFVTLRQVHGNRIVHLEKVGPGNPFLEGDGIITACQDVAIGIKTADCVPILLVDHQSPAVGVVHAGWRGTAAGIVEEAVEAMKKTFSTDPSRLVAVIGPAIGPCCYEVDEPVYRAMAGRRKRERFIHPRRGAERWMLDLAKANEIQLVNAGVRESCVHSANLCTACHREMFFSHRGDGGVTGRQVNFIFLRSEDGSIPS